MYLEHGSIPRSGLGPHYFLHQNPSPLLQSTEVRSQAHAYLTGTLRALDCAPLEVGGVADHVHIFCGLSRKISLSELVKNLKTSSSKILKGKVHDGFSWQNGYGAFSVSQSASKSVFSYMPDPESHHRRMTFQEEFRALLNKHEIRFDERYVWDCPRQILRPFSTSNPADGCFSTKALRGNAL